MTSTLPLLDPIPGEGHLYEGVGFGIGYGYGQITQRGGASYRAPISLGSPAAGVGPVPQRAPLPPIRLQPAQPSTRDVDSATPGDPEVSDEETEVLDPFFRPLYTVFESAPGGIYETNRAPTDWDAVYEQYVELNKPEAEVAIDWGEIAGTIVGGLFDPFGAGQATTSFFQPQQAVPSIAAVPQMGAPAPGAVSMAGAAGCPPTGPKYGKICLATGVITPLRRRRRRRLLTSSDIKDLSALKSIVGGAALQGAVVQAVRR